MDLSDFYKLVVSVLKSYFKKEDPKVTMCMDYKSFDKEKSSNEHENELRKIRSLALNYDILKLFFDIVNEHAPF